MNMRMIIFAFVILAAGLSGCGLNAGGSAPEELTLYSLDPKDRPPKDIPKTDESFHGFPVLGKIAIKEAAKRREIMTALKEGMGHGEMAKCFNPRHGIRAVDKGKAVDYVICFECGQVVIHKDGDPTTVSTNGHAQPILNKHLMEAGLK